MTTIYKYPLILTDDQVLEVPAGAKPLCAQIQNGQPCLWMQVVPSNQMVQRTVRIFGTGGPIATEKLSYVGSVQYLVFVWHVYVADE